MILKDDQFIRGKIPMTKEEVRAVVMAKAEIAKDSFVIDVGAGTGSLAIQAALIAAEGKVFALEYKPEAIELIKKNCVKHQVKNLQLIEQTAPEGLRGLPQANAIIIGGSGGRLADILTVADKLLADTGRLVVTSVTLATLGDAINIMANLNYSLDICQVSVTKYEPVSSHYMAKAHNPIFIITGQKERKIDE